MSGFWGSVFYCFCMDCFSLRPSGLALHRLFFLSVIAFLNFAFSPMGTERIFPPHLFFCGERVDAPAAKIFLSFAISLDCHFAALSAFLEGCRPSAGRFAKNVFFDTI